MTEARSEAAPRIAALTMARDEEFFLPIWVEHHARAFGAENLFVVDHASDPGPMAALRARLPAAVNMLRIPHAHGAAWTEGLTFDRRRFVLLNGVLQGLRAHYDVVVHTDVDELLVSDPRAQRSLAAHVGARPAPFVAGIGIELLHDIGREAPWHPARPLFEQRRTFRYRFRYCKPHVVSGEGRLTTHGCDGPFLLDPDLFLVHLKYLDRDAVVARQERVHGLYGQGPGGRKSRWSLDSDAMSAEFDAIAAADPPGQRFGHKPLLERLFGTRGPVVLPLPEGGPFNEALKHIPWRSARRLERTHRRIPGRFASPQNAEPPCSEATEPNA
jgi:hypothetical protein